MCAIVDDLELCICIPSWQKILLLTAIQLLTQICVNIIVQYSSIEVRHLYSDRTCNGSKSHNCWKYLVEQNWVQKLVISPWMWCTGCPKLTFAIIFSTWSLDLMFCALPKRLLLSVSRDHGGGSVVSKWFVYASVKWGCLGIPKTSRVDFVKRHKADRSSWLSGCSILVQLQPALPTSKLCQKSAIQSQYTTY